MAHDTQTIEDTRTIAAAYFDAWRDDDFDTYRSLLADDVEFIGPLAHIEGADEATEGIRGMSKIKTDIVVKKVFVDGDDALTWFDLHTKIADPVPTANWTHVENGKITKIQVAFDARELAPPDEK
jgi:ketosteroid isomerase-like protein